MNKPAMLWVTRKDGTVDKYGVPVGYTLPDTLDRWLHLPAVEYGEGRWSAATIRLDDVRSISVVDP
jgi:hypothetical protein